MSGIISVPFSKRMSAFFQACALDLSTGFEAEGFSIRMDNLVSASQIWKRPLLLDTLFGRRPDMPYIWNSDLAEIYLGLIYCFCNRVFICNEKMIYAEGSNKGEEIKDLDTITEEEAQTFITNFYGRIDEHQEFEDEKLIERKRLVSADKERLISELSDNGARFRTRIEILNKSPNQKTFENAKLAIREYSRNYINILERSLISILDHIVEEPILGIEPNDVENYLTHSIWRISKKTKGIPLNKLTPDGPASKIDIEAARSNAARFRILFQSLIRLHSIGEIPIPINTPLAKESRESIFHYPLSQILESYDLFVISLVQKAPFFRTKKTETERNKEKKEEEELPELKEVVVPSSLESLKGIEEGLGAIISNH